MSLRRNLIALAVLAVAGAAVVIGLSVRADVEQAHRGGEAATRPASQPASQPAAKYPPDELVSACEAAAEKLRGRLDESFNVAVSPPFVAAGNFSRRKLDAYVKLSVVRPAGAMWKSYFEKKPPDPITILLFADGRSYRHFAAELFGDTNLPHFGYCRSDGTLVMNIATGSGTLVHELTHALIKYDFPRVPQWFNEGLASLHEQCTVGDERIVGLVNWRLPGLQAAIRAGELRPLRELVTARDFYGRRRGINYAQARYFVMYVQRQGALEKFYRTLRELIAGPAADEGASADESAEAAAAATRPAGGEAADETSADEAASPSPDVSAIEQTLGRSIDQIDESMRKWVMTLQFD
ncbi:MAG: gluzincin family metallopeptidase [Planctomycetota bacterium]|jgi:hypothetical protein